MNSNPTTLSVDEQIDKFLDDNNISRFEDTGYYGIVPNIIEIKIKSLIRQVCEEVTPDRCTATRGNTQNPNNPMYSTKYAKGWNDCIDEQRTKLNKMLGKK